MSEQETQLLKATRKPCVTAVLRMAGLRPTKQRVALGEILFEGRHRHVNAEALHSETEAKNMKISLATVYNTLHQFTEAGLLRQVSIDASKTYFDTNTSHHHHFYIEDTQQVVDMPSHDMVIEGLPQAPFGTEVTSIDVVVRVRKTS